MASSGVDEKGLKRGAVQSCLLFPMREAPPGAPGGATRVHAVVKELDELRAYGHLRGRAAAPEASRASASANPDVSDSGSVLLGVGANRRRKAADDRRFNGLTDLPPVGSRVVFAARRGAFNSRRKRS